MTRSEIARSIVVQSATEPRRRASAENPTASLTIRSTIAVGAMAPSRAPWEGLSGTNSPRRRRSAPHEYLPTKDEVSARDEMPRSNGGPVPPIARGRWHNFIAAIRLSPQRELVVDPSEWVPTTPSRFATARSFLPSRGLVISTIVAVVAWAWVGTCLQSVDPYAPYALIGLLFGTAVGIAAVIAPPLRVLALRYGRTRRFRQAAWWHGVRQGSLVGLAVAVNGGLLAFRQWAPIGAVAVAVGVIAIEAMILAVFLSVRGRAEPLLQ